MKILYSKKFLKDIEHINEKRIKEAVKKIIENTKNIENISINIMQKILIKKRRRLPNIMELESIVDRTVFNPAIDILFFPATAAYNYWSSSTYVGATGRQLRQW